MFPRVCTCAVRRTEDAVADRKSALMVIAGNERYRHSCKQMSAMPTPYVGCSWPGCASLKRAVYETCRPVLVLAL